MRGDVKKKTEKNNRAKIKNMETKKNDNKKKHIKKHVKTKCLHVF